VPWRVADAGQGNGSSGDGARPGAAPAGDAMRPYLTAWNARGAEAGLSIVPRGGASPESGSRAPRGAEAAWDPDGPRPRARSPVPAPGAEAWAARRQLSKVDGGSSADRLSPLLPRSLASAAPAAPADAGPAQAPSGAVGPASAPSGAAGPASAPVVSPPGLLGPDPRVAALLAAQLVEMERAVDALRFGLDARCAARPPPRTPVLIGLTSLPPVQTGRVSLPRAVQTGRTSRGPARAPPRCFSR